jgi:AraC-like DNA-binding protein
MPEIAVQSFADPDAYHGAIRNLVKGVVTERGSYHAKLTRIDFDHVWMQRGEEGLARVLHYTPSGQRTSILFPSDQRQATAYASGREVSEGEISLLGYAWPSYYRSSAECRWAAVSLSLNELAAAGEAILGRELTAPPSTHHLRPPPPLLLRLRSLHEAAGRLAEFTPDILANPEVARAIEQGLIHAMVASLGARGTVEVGHMNRTHAGAMRRLEEVLEANSDHTLYVAELCAAARMSYPTLRAVCREHMGMSPMQYLRLRRLHLARHALLAADRARSSVTEIATDYGFWELGRFSVAYRSLFGESPSASLRRPPEEPRPQRIVASPWDLPESA